MPVCDKGCPLGTLCIHYGPGRDAYQRGRDDEREWWESRRQSLGPHCCDCDALLSGLAHCCVDHDPSRRILMDLIAGLKRHPDVAVQRATYKLLNHAEARLREVTGDE